MQTDTYDLLVIGAGPAGSAAATVAADQRRRVALVERDKIGGTCLNYGCDPTKALLSIADLLDRARRAEQLGLRIADAQVDWPAVQRHLAQLVDRVRGGSDKQTREDLSERGIDVFEGQARFVSPHEVVAGDCTLRAERIIIATGSQAVIPEVAGLRDAGFITNKEAIWLPDLPRRLAIVGGGPIGVEFAQLFRRFGVEVTLLEQGPIVLPKDDRELADTLCELLSDAGIRIETNVDLRQVQRQDGAKLLAYRCPEHSQEQLLVDEILVAVGYQPALAELNLAAAEVATNDDGVVTDSYLRTSAPHIWAAGDVAGGYQFTHVAYDQGRLAARNAFATQPQEFDRRVIPWVTYTSPELAHVGKTEQQLREEGIGYRVGRKPMDAVERAVVTGQPEGVVKLLIGDDGRVLGAHILSAGAGELIAPATLAMRAGLTAEQLASTILPYPTLAEGLRWAAEEALSAANHNPDPPFDDGR
jgi:pyruvate/2-oxoglutarate dehydrogenase complex dihydrolipoamide dehydrogenase (E3) component